MNWLGWLPWRRRVQHTETQVNLDEATRDTERARESLADAERLGTEVHELSRRLGEHYRRNGFARLVDAAFHARREGRRW